MLGQDIGSAELCLPGFPPGGLAPVCLLAMHPGLVLRETPERELHLALAAAGLAPVLPFALHLGLVLRETAERELHLALAAADLAPVLPFVPIS